MVTLRDSWSLALVVLMPLLLVLVLLVGCADEIASEIAAGGDETGFESPGDEVLTDAPVEAAAGCAAANEVCFSVKIPEDMVGTPEAIIVGLYTQLPPMGPPNVFPPYRVDTPDVAPGDILDVKMTVMETGTYQAYTVLYMPNGGLQQWMPKAGVDFEFGTEPFELTGDAYTHGSEIALELAVE